MTDSWINMLAILAIAVHCATAQFQFIQNDDDVPSTFAYRLVAYPGWPFVVSHSVSSQNCTPGSSGDADPDFGSFRTAGQMCAFGNETGRVYALKFAGGTVTAGPGTGLFSNGYDCGGQHGANALYFGWDIVYSQPGCDFLGSFVLLQGQDLDFDAFRMTSDQPVDVAVPVYSTQVSIPDGAVYARYNVNPSPGGSTTFSGPIASGAIGCTGEKAFVVAYYNGSTYAYDCTLGGFASAGPNPPTGTFTVTNYTGQRLPEYCGFTTPGGFVQTCSPVFTQTTCGNYQSTGVYSPQTSQQCSPDLCYAVGGSSLPLVVDCDLGYVYQVAIPASSNLVAFNAILRFTGYPPQQQFYIYQDTDDTVYCGRSSTILYEGSVRNGTALSLLPEVGYNCSIVVRNGVTTIDGLGACSALPTGCLCSLGSISGNVVDRTVGCGNHTTTAVYDLEYNVTGSAYSFYSIGEALNCTGCSGALAFAARSDEGTCIVLCGAGASKLVPSINGLPFALDVGDFLSLPGCPYSILGFVAATTTTTATTSTTTTTTTTSLPSTVTTQATVSTSTTILTTTSTSTATSTATTATSTATATAATASTGLSSSVTTTTTQTTTGSTSATPSTMTSTSPPTTVATTSTQHTSTQVGATTTGATTVTTTGLTTTPMAVTSVTSTIVVSTTPTNTTDGNSTGWTVGGYAVIWAPVVLLLVVAGLFLLERGFY